MPIRRFKPTISIPGPSVASSAEHFSVGSPVGPSSGLDSAVASPRHATEVVVNKGNNSVVPSGGGTDVHSPVPRKRPTSISFSISPSVYNLVETTSAASIENDNNSNNKKEALATTPASTPVSPAVSSGHRLRNHQPDALQPAAVTMHMPPVVAGPPQIRRAHSISHKNNNNNLQENLIAAKSLLAESRSRSPSPSSQPLPMSTAGETGSNKLNKKGRLLTRPIELPSKEDIVVEKLKMRDFLLFNPDGSPMRWRKQLREHDGDQSVVLTPVGSADILNQQSTNIKGRLRGASVCASSPPPSSNGAPGMGGTPRVRLGASGEAIINEDSLVIDTTGPPPDPSNASRVSAVHEELESTTTYTTYASYRRKGYVRGRRWSKEETARFFVALRCCGLDFSMISKFFPEREERELRSKFKAEDKRNPDVVTQFLNGGGDEDAATYDPLALLATSSVVNPISKTEEKIYGTEEKAGRKRPPRSNSKRGEGLPRGRGSKVRLAIGEDSISSAGSQNQDSDGNIGGDDDIIVKKKGNSQLKKRKAIESDTETTANSYTVPSKKAN